MLGQHRDLDVIFVIDRWIIRVDAGDFVGVAATPIELIYPALTHADEGGFLSQAVLFRQKFVPPVPRLALPSRVGRYKGDVKTASQQFDFGLRLVVPIAGLPRPRTAGRRLLGNNYDAAALTVFYAHVDTEARHLARRGRKGRNRSGGIVHNEVVADVPVPSSFLAGKGNVSICCN